MKSKRSVKKTAICLCLCLVLFAAAVQTASAATPALDGFLEKYGPHIGDSFGSLADWLDGQTEKLSPELRETLRSIDTDDLLRDLKPLLGETASLDDAQLRDAITEIAEAHGLHLVDSQIEQLMTLCRALEKLNIDRLKERLDELRPEAAKHVGLRGVLENVRRALRSAADWLSEKLSGLF